MEPDKKTSRSQEEPTNSESGNVPLAGKPRTLNNSLRRAKVLVRWFWRKARIAALENYYDARDAFHDVSRRIRLELRTRGFSRSRRHRATGWKAPGLRKSDSPAMISGIHQPEVAQALAKGLATLEPARFTGIHPIQSREMGVRFRNVLIVGGMDFFGAALVHQLNALGVRDITVTDSLDDAICRRLPALKIREFLAREEIGESARFRPLTEFSHIFYLDGWKAETIGFTKHLLASAFKSGGRFIAISPVAFMYPQAACPVEERHNPDHFRPLTPSGVLSCLFDRYALAKAPNKNYLSLKCHQLFGPGERTGRGLDGLIKSCHTQIRSTGAVRLPAALGPGTPEGLRKFDFFPVLEAAHVALYLSQNHFAAGVYELGSGVATAPAALVQAVIAATGGKRKIVWDKTLDYEPPPQQPEHAFLGRLLEAGWKPFPPDLNTAVRHYTTSYLDHGIDLGEEPPEPGKPHSKTQTDIPHASRRRTFDLPPKRSQM